MDETKNKEEMKEENKKNETPVSEKPKAQKKPKSDDGKKKAEEAAKKKYDELNEKYLRMAAEYDNFRKRSAKERESIYGDAYGDALKQILPVLDNLERAAAFCDNDKVSKGVEMTLSQFYEALKKMGVEEINPEAGSAFDPAVHNAVMHIEDETLGEGVIAEVFGKGYRKGDKILRYAMVKVAN